MLIRAEINKSMSHKKLKVMTGYAIKHVWADHISLTDIYYSKEGADSAIKRSVQGIGPDLFEVVKLKIKQVY